jgi:serine phosphatase RsbU (regulator of sigma subunit)
MLPKKALGRLRASTAIVVILGLGVTAVITVLARVNYTHTEQRLTALQASLTGQLLQTAPLQIESTLDRVAGLSAESSNPVATFDSAMAPSMKPRGQFVSCSLVLVSRSGPEVLAHLGAAPIRNPKGAVASAIYEQAAKSSALVTSRAVSQGVQRLGYLVSAHGPRGTFVVAAGQQLPVDSRLSIAAGSPDAQLDIALYFGKGVTSGDLIASSSPNLPIRGTVSTVTVAFGTGWLTLVAAPRSALAGGWAENLPWVILVAGLILTASVAVIAEWLARRRRIAETVAGETRELYLEQREISEALQLALLPKTLPPVRGADVVAQYLPPPRGVEVGGDWYSLTPVDADRFVFAIGDVSGHGIGAASTMASLRFSIRALAKLGMSPAEILERAGNEIDETDRHIATALVGIVDISDSSVALASAGHFPPLLVSSSASEYIDLPPGPPLGLRHRNYESRKFNFDIGDTLIAFTDGLIEKRGVAIDAGMQDLASVASRPEESARAAMAAILAELPGDEHNDDVALLVVRRLDGPVDAGPSRPQAVSHVVAPLHR